MPSNMHPSIRFVMGNFIKIAIVKRAPSAFIMRKNLLKLRVAETQKLRQSNAVKSRSCPVHPKGVILIY